MSMEGMSEAYNETWLESDEVKKFNDFLAQNKNVGNHFNKKIKESKNGEEICPSLSDFSNLKTSLKQGKDVFSGMVEMHRKSVSQVVFNFFIHEEIKERKMVGKFLFGPYYLDDTKKKLFTYRDSVEKLFEDVEEMRVSETYKHRKCSGVSSYLYRD